MIGATAHWWHGARQNDPTRAGGYRRRRGSVASSFLHGGGGWHYPQYVVRTATGRGRRSRDATATTQSHLSDGATFLATAGSNRVQSSRFWRADVVAVALIVALTVVLAVHRGVHDNWLGRHDVLAFFLPWYAYLGERLAAGELPGWNPHLFSGTPFAGDPESGWTYLPAMLTFPFFPAALAFKVMIFVQLLIAGLSTYAYARVMGLGVVAGLLAANLFEFGGFLYQNTYCCTVRAQIGTWIPLSLLAVELALRASTWRGRLAAWFLGGLAVSQLFAGWMGQGAMDALLL